MAQGAGEVAPGHCPLIVVLHAAWIACLVIFGHDRPVHRGWLAVFAVLQMPRAWILATPGRRWTTRIVVTDEPLVARGPFRYLRHPDHALVVAEIAVAPMVPGLVWVAILFSVLNAIVLGIRVRAEDGALTAGRT